MNKKGRHLTGKRRRWAANQPKYNHFTGRMACTNAPQSAECAEGKFALKSKDPATATARQILLQGPVKNALPRPGREQRTYEVIKPSQEPGFEHMAQAFADSFAFFAFAVLGTFCLPAFDPATFFTFVSFFSFSDSLSQASLGR